MRNWIEKKIIDWAIRKIKETDNKEAKQEILKLAVKNLYNSISEEDILHQNSDGNWVFRGRALTQAEIIRLKQEAVLLKGMRLWYALKQDIKYQLGKKMFEEAKCLDDILWGQLVTYLFDIIKTRIDKMPVE